MSQVAEKVKILKVGIIPPPPPPAFHLWSCLVVLKFGENKFDKKSDPLYNGTHGKRKQQSYALKVRILMGHKSMSSFVQYAEHCNNLHSFELKTYCHSLPCINRGAASY
jgi:hypothetical protein